MPKLDPSKLSAAAELMAPRLALVAALDGGTETMRQAGQSYLPQFVSETDEAYNRRLSRAVLLNYFRRALDTMTGKPFSRPLVIDGLPNEFEELIEDCDKQGSHINSFAREVFRAGLRDGLTHVLVDYDRVSANTLEEEREVKPRPYFCHIPHCDVIAAYAEIQGGVEVLTHIRLRECVTVRDGFDEQTVRRVRILEPGRWELWESDRNNNWKIVEQGETSLPYIPLLTFYTDRQGFHISCPPLTDLAHLNVAHWQSASDQRNVLTVARFPLLAASGLNPDEAAKVVLGPNRILSAISKDSKYYYVEHTGAAIAAGRADLEDLKAEMAAMSVDIMRRPGTLTTATEVSIDTAQATNALQDAARRLGDYLENLYGIALDWLGRKNEEGPSFTVFTDFNIGADQLVEVTAISELRKTRDLSRKQLMKEMVRRQVLSDDYDAEADLTQIQIENDLELQQTVERNTKLGLNPDGTSKQPQQGTIQ